MNTFLRCEGIVNLGRDPEVRYTAGGMAIANISVASSHSYKKNDEWCEETEWTRCVAFGKTAERIGEYLRKGSCVYIEGRLKTNKWEDKEGVTKYATDLVLNKIDFLTGWGKDEGGQANGRTNDSPPSGRKEYKTPVDPSSADDDIPF